MASAQPSPRLVARVNRTWRKPGAALLALTTACAAIGGAQSRAAGIRLSDVRVWSTGEVTRVALEITAETRFTHDRLQNPDRVYLDLHETRPGGARGLAYTLPVADGPIRQVRVALTLPTVTRVVLDLDGLVEYSVSQLANPDRVMIEVRRSAGTPAPASLAPVPAAPVPAAPAQVSAAPPPPKPRPRQFVPPEDASNSVRPPVIGKAPYVAPPSAARLKGYPFSTDQPQPLMDAKPEPAVTAAVLTERTEPTPLDKPRQPAAAAGMEPRPAQRNRSGSHSMTRVLGLKLNRVVLDPGHGGHDHGTTGRAGVIEKEIVLDVALRLGKLIEERLGAEVAYTRTSDAFLSLEDRTRIANQQRADLFLSIHANSSPYKTVSGTETYYLSFTTSKADMEVAARENAGSQRSMHELSDLLRQIALQDKAAESREFAARVQATAYELAVQSHGKIRNRGVKKAPFVVLIGAQMPSILTEIGFVSNPREEALLKRPDHRQKIAEALYKGIYQYAETLSHFSVASRASATGAQ